MERLPGGIVPELVASVEVLASGRDVSLHTDHEPSEYDDSQASLVRLTLLFRHGG